MRMFLLSGRFQYLYTQNVKVTADLYSVFQKVFQLRALTINETIGKKGKKEMRIITVIKMFKKKFKM